ncbi:hypothetical protein BD414DRAFT_489561 [Trametes punicea]|nr:hypothetical protein BD414DRAFT_489561 [Trametes punicea]
MRFASSVSALALAAVVLAQDVVIHVGFQGDNPGLAFNPPNVTASNGSTVTFMFNSSPSNHSVNQSPFATPCQPLANGFSSGFVTVPANITDGFPTWNLTITDDTKPIWFYCSQTTGAKEHCLAGMVGSINAPQTGNTFQSFLALATAASSVVQPTPALSGVNAVATAPPSPLSSPFTGTDNPTGTLPAPKVSAASASGSGASSGSGTGSASSPSSTKNSAGSVQISGFTAFLAAAFGLILA